MLAVILSLVLMKFYLLLTCLILAQASLAAEVYRIVDEHGRVTYSQIPPHKDAEKIKIKGGKSSVESTNTQSNANLQERQKKYSDYLESERLERKEKRDKAKQEKAELAANCHSVRAELNDMNQGGIIYYDLDENGERVFIDESRIDAKKQKLREYLDRNCKKIIKQ